MLGEGRDILATFFLERRLSVLREEHIYMSLKGNSPGWEYWPEGEELILQQMKVQFFNAAVNKLVVTEDTPEPTEDQAFDSRTQKITEQAILMTHRRLADIPFVGQLEYNET